MQESVAQPPWSAQHYPALDLMANWTSERPTMSQIMDGLSSQDGIDVHRQIDDAANNWRSDDAIN